MRQDDESRREAQAFDADPLAGNWHHAEAAPPDVAQGACSRRVDVGGCAGLSLDVKAVVHAAKANHRQRMELDDLALRGYTEQRLAFYIRVLCDRY